MLKNLTPIYVENSSVPKYLSYFVPIEINAITLFFIVFSRGKISDKTRRHECIHFQQFLETFIVGFLVVYALEYVWGLWLYRNGPLAYRRISLEQEAYEYDDDPKYLLRRKRYIWIKFRP